MLLLVIYLRRDLTHLTKQEEMCSSPVESILNKEVIPYKKLNEFPLELWYMNQIEDEEEPFEVAFDSEEG
ncbi:MAG: hypothetical protein CM15mV2_2790 [uncultured marine virus]|nr:MAG: hypothetical protein CM15mV2_2790 [uncultured marine virus]